MIDWRIQLLRPILVLLVGTGLIGRVSAQIIKVSGSTEFRQATNTAIVSSLANPQIDCVVGNLDGTDISNVTEAMIAGSFEIQRFVIKLDWSTLYNRLQAINSAACAM